MEKLILVCRLPNLVIDTDTENTQITTFRYKDVLRKRLILFESRREFLQEVASEFPWQLDPDRLKETLDGGLSVAVTGNYSVAGASMGNFSGSLEKMYDLECLVHVILLKLKVFYLGMGNVKSDLGWESWEGWENDNWSSESAWESWDYDNQQQEGSTVDSVQADQLRSVCDGGALQMLFVALSCEDRQTRSEACAALSLLRSIFKKTIKIVKVKKFKKNEANASSDTQVQSFSFLS